MSLIYSTPILMRATKSKACYRIAWREDLGRDFYGQKPRSGVRVLWVSSGTSPEDALAIAHTRYLASR
jgi:hypothetical protein